ncbi:DinB family protein [Devosia sp. RR2S18]|jgi:uncharacterized damage-inducible protein DinB|uniref:DinB family protein n=1 Tax=Devosia rhizosphaerae TaxID=3049774 RepID=UPI002541402C|nr:DinB family protein [Devosia sp. RR2S18]WIJ23481.1 DinB family protein [Devosia sp. RR2S18]HEV7293588.1 DinB family protein [Devosia sp.]
MITSAYVQTMAAYNAELNRRVFGAALRLSDETRRADGGVFWKSIHGTLNHVFWADRTWLSRFGHGEPLALKLSQSDTVFDDFDELWRERQQLDVNIEHWAANLPPSALDGDLRWYSAAVGKEMSKSRALCVMQLFNHQTHHRGQVHALITRAGEQTGDTDLPFVIST